MTNTGTRAPNDTTPVEHWRRYKPLLVAAVFASGLLPVVGAVAGHTYLYPVNPVRILTAASVFVLYSAALYIVARTITRRLSTSVVIVIVWSVGIFIYPELVLPPQVGGLPEAVSASLFLAFAALICALIHLRQRLADHLAVPLSLCVAVMFVSGAVQIVPPYLHHAFRLRFTPLVEQGALHPPDRLPNIYHLVLDEMGRPDLLRTRYGIDLSGMKSSLTALGFTVEDDAVANYAQTYLSIPSMLNADYVRIPEEGVNEVSRVPLHDVIEQNAVFATLRQAGYVIEFLASDYSATQHNAQATICRCDPPVFGEFEADILYRTAFRAILPGNFDYIPHRNRVERTLDAFAASADSGSAAPHYTFAHVLGPHPPFIFKADGTFAPPRRAFTFIDGSMYPGTISEYRAGYAQQVDYIARRAAAEAAALVARDPTAVVIISGDHGPRLGFSALDAQLTDATEVFPVFLAIRWGANASPSHVDSLVNVYRAVLNRYLGTSLPMLPKHSYVSSFATPYKLLERAVR